MLSFCSWHMCDCFHLVPSWNEPEQTLSLQNRLISLPAGRHDPKPCFSFIRLQFMHILVLLFLLLRLGRSFSIQLYLCSRPTSTPPPPHACMSVRYKSKNFENDGRQAYGYWVAYRKLLRGPISNSLRGYDHPFPKLQPHNSLQILHQSNLEIWKYFFSERVVDRWNKLEDGQLYGLVLPNIEVCGC